MPISEKYTHELEEIIGELLRGGDFIAKTDFVFRCRICRRDIRRRGADGWNHYQHADDCALVKARGIVRAMQSGD